MELNSHIGFSDPKICGFFMSSGLPKIEQIQELPWIEAESGTLSIVLYYLSKIMA